MSQRKIERDGSYTIREIVKVVAISLSRMHFIVKLLIVKNTILNDRRP